MFWHQDHGDLQVMLQKNQEVDEETSYKEAFKVLSPKAASPGIGLTFTYLTHFFSLLAFDGEFVKSTILWMC